MGFIIIGDTTGYSSVVDRIFTIFFHRVLQFNEMVLGNVDNEAFNANVIGVWTWCGSVFMGIFFIIKIIVVLNMLIAMMGETFSAVREGSGFEFVLY